MLTESTHYRLRLVFAIRTAVTAVAVAGGYILGDHKPRQLADALSVGLAVMAVAVAFAFALRVSITHSRAVEEIRYRDREMVRLGGYILRLTVTSSVLIVSYVGLGGAFTQGENLVSVLGAASAGVLAWTLCSMSEMFLRYGGIVAGAEDEHPGFGGIWQPLRLFRNTTSTELQQTPSGWFVPGRPGYIPDDSPVFIAKELAVRYGALRSAARQQYVQICDMAEQNEAAERIARIESCLQEMDRLCGIEQRMLEILPKDSASLKYLT